MEEEPKIRFGVVEKLPHLTDVKECEPITGEMTPGNPVTGHLQRQTANTLVLFFNYKHYQWRALEPLLRELNSSFREFALGVLITGDTAGGAGGVKRRRSGGGGYVCEGGRIHEDHEWQLREILKASDGLPGPAQPAPA